MTKLSSRLPKGHANGLERLAGRLIAEPHRPRFAIVAIDCMRVTSDMDTGEQEPTARILRIEALDLSDFVDAHLLMRRAYDRRVGQDPLPFDGERTKADDSIDTLFKAARDSTGRVHLTHDDDGNITAVTIDGQELTIASAEEALEDTDTEDRDPLLSVAMDAVIQAQDASVEIVVQALRENDPEDPDGDEPTDEDRAARAELILAQLEAAGIVAAADEKGHRVVLFTRDGIRLDLADGNDTDLDGDPIDDEDDPEDDDPPF